MPFDCKNTTYLQYSSCTWPWYSSNSKGCFNSLCTVAPTEPTNKGRTLSSDRSYMDSIQNEWLWKQPAVTLYTKLNFKQALSEEELKVTVVNVDMPRQYFIHLSNALYPPCLPGFSSCFNKSFMRLNNVLVLMMCNFSLAKKITIWCFQNQSCIS